MNFEKLQLIFKAHGCQKLYIKKLSLNDNSKNQVYFGDNFELLNVFPVSKIESVSAGGWKRERFKAALSFTWIGEDGSLYSAPNAKLILYPKYPEVRFSGFLKGCKHAPSKLMRPRLSGRLLFLSVTKEGTLLGFATTGDSSLASEIKARKITETLGVFSVVNINPLFGNRENLIGELIRIHKLDWIESKRLNSTGEIVPCPSPNCGGYTLEAELGIRPNGYSEPDFLGWEIKQFGVRNFDRLNGAVITLMTPEPNGGFYRTGGIIAFVKRYGYLDKSGVEDRMNFGGIHKLGQIQKLTNLRLELIGFDVKSGRIRNANGMIALIDSEGNTAASWSFSSLLIHWNRKHNQACYLPSLSVKEPQRKYKFGNKAILGIGTDFQLFVSEMAKGNIYYDPGIKVENISTSPIVKKRSQFRIKSKNLSSLYNTSEVLKLI